VTDAADQAEPEMQAQAEQRAKDGEPAAGAEHAEQEPAPEPATSVDEHGIPDYVSRSIVLYRTAIGVRRGTRCHPGGHAVGTADVYLTFTPKGRVSEARLDGEPLESSAVASCIVDHLRAVRIPAFNGAPFTVKQSITMR
jgi:hypothetical protein